MKFLLGLLSLSLMQMAAPTDLVAQMMDTDRERSEWEGEQDRRRSEEGEHFDEAAYEFEKAQMARRHDLEERRRHLDGRMHEAFRAWDRRGLPRPIYDQERQALEHRHGMQMEEIEAAMRALDEEAHQYWINRQRAETERQMSQWEEEQERRRQQEGEHFDEAAYELERAQMELRRELEEHRVRLDEEIHEAYRELEERHEQERQALHRREREQRDELEAQFGELEEANQQYWVDKQRSDMGRQAQEWEIEQERRREDEGEYFDEAAHEFEKTQMARRQELEERRIHLEEQLKEAFKVLAGAMLFGDALDAEREQIESRHRVQMEELEAHFRALDDEAHRYWADRQHMEQERHQQEWEADQQRRREEEGEHFDEQAYEFKKAQMARRQQLDERRMSLEEEIHEAFRALDDRDMPGPDYDREREAIERRQQTQMEELEAQYRALDDETHEYWTNRQRSDQERNQQEWEQEQDRRRQEEGEYFDEEAYEFEKAQMARRQQLDERRMRLEAQLHEAFKALNEKSLPAPMYDVEQRSIERRHEEQIEELELEFRALDDEMQQYWADRQRSEMQSHLHEWEEEQERRRQEEGEYFDEEAYQFEKAHMARRQELEERRMHMDAEMHEEFQALNDKNISGSMYDVERRSIERRHEARMEELEA